MPETTLRDTGARYEMDEQGQTSYADYRLDGSRMYLDYVFSPPALRGSGASGRLMSALSQDARDRGLQHHPDLRLRRRLAAPQPGVQGPGGR